ncbi:MAG: UDP-3-O-[3-hydroxymyristoyl] N-acetylglucosamine deacetylase [Alphaproteobacteria bacterium GM7ARS4]|nr:UDP-3-O-[3-hydroxymyristoyl] N-acetylglucosamine deacetylase [Alphaproteobacteria bacterium GM7ARS4]
MIKAKRGARMITGRDVIQDGTRGVGVCQQTIEQTTSTKGKGLHTGKRITLTMHAAAAGTGIVFMADGKRTPALWRNVVATRMNTSLGEECKGISLWTVEHMMGALAGCGIDNMVVEVEGGEMPAMDGSALAFADMIKRAGIKKQDRARRYIRLLKEVHVTNVDDGGYIVATPSQRASFDYTIDFPHPLIGKQQYDYHEQGMEHFYREIAPARTFGFMEDIERLRAQNLGLGGDRDNVVILNHQAVVNGGALRFADEFVRHKILDALGDTFLAGARIIARMACYRAGHGLHHRFVQALMATPDAWCWSSVFDEGNVGDVSPQSHMMTRSIS